jgi:hypothetical protein
VVYCFAPATGQSLHLQAAWKPSFLINVVVLQNPFEESPQPGLENMTIIFAKSLERETAYTNNFSGPIKTDVSHTGFDFVVL